jgi:hypothetical protein
MLILMHASPAIADSKWRLREMVDPLTDEKVTMAFSSSGEGLAQRSAVVECRGSKFNVYFDFGEYLGKLPKEEYLVPVRYRVDKEPLESKKWFSSVDGTAIFAIEHFDIARRLMKGSTFIIEAQDYRGKLHRASFDLSGAKKVLGRVLQQCKVSDTGLDQSIPGLRKEIALEIEKWGPKVISHFKKILNALGVYDGPHDALVDPVFALAVQNFYDDYIQQCRDKKLSGNFCKILEFSWESGQQEPIGLLVALLFSERAPRDLKVDRNIYK